MAAENTVCFSNVTFQAIQQRLEEIRLDSNLRKDMQRENAKALRTVLAGQNVGLGALLIPDREGQDFYAYWDHIPRTQAVDCRSLEDCVVPTGEEVQQRKTKFILQHCIESEPITINEAKYRSSPSSLETTLSKQFTDRILALENKANEILLQFLYDNRGSNEYDYEGLVGLSGNDTYFAISTIANPDNLAYLIDFIDYMNLGSVSILDGGALNKAILLSKFNAADDDKRSQLEKWNELMDGTFESYVNDIRGTGNFLRNISDTKHPDGIKRGYFIIEKGAVSFLSKHNYPALANPEDLAVASRFFESIGIGDYAKQFGQSGTTYETSDKGLNYAVPSIHLSQTFIPAQGGDPVTLPVYIDVEHDIVCSRDATSHARSRIHNIVLRLKFGIFLAPTGIDTGNTGVFLFSENCDATIPTICDTDPCATICDDLLIEYDVVGNDIQFAATPISEYCADGGAGSGFSITSQEIKVYRVVNGTALGELVATLTNANLATAQIVSGLALGEQYTIVASAVFDATGDAVCTKTAQHCITIAADANPCAGIDVDFVIAENVDEDMEISMTVRLTAGNINIASGVSAYNLSVTDSAGDVTSLGTGVSAAAFTQVIPGGIAAGYGYVTGTVQVGDCTITVNELVSFP